jgi:hypothetical protein
LALEAIKSGTSTHQASKDYGIPRTTIIRRLQGAQTRTENARDQGRLSVYQESELVKWISIQDSLGLAPTHRQIRGFVVRLLKSNNDLQPLGKHWLEGFIKRHPSIRTLRSKPIDSARVSGASIEAINSFFNSLNRPELTEILPNNRWNMDEVGLCEGIGTNGLVVGQSGKSYTFKQQLGTRTWTSIIESCNALGTKLPPLVIFKGLSLQQQWFPKDLAEFNNWFFESSNNGWTDNNIGFYWLKEVFEPLTRPNQGLRRLLILDGHASHESEDFMWYCYQYKIQLCYLPPKTSHVLQPLDLSIFSPLKREYREQLALQPLFLSSTPIGRANFLTCYSKARNIAFNSSNIIGGWKASGLWPINRAKPLLSRFIFISPLAEDLIVLVKKPKQLPPNIPIYPNLLNNQLLVDNSANFIFKTPSRSIEVKKIAKATFKLNYQDPTIRKLFTQLGKGLDKKNLELANLKSQKEVLEAKVKALQPIKKQQVKRNPNKVFATIKEIKETREIQEAKQKALEVKLNPEKASKEAYKAQFKNLCLEWQLNPSKEEESGS